MQKLKVLIVNLIAIISLIMFPSITIKADEFEFNFESPECSTNMYMMMDYHSITDTTTNQWEFQQSDNLNINTATGLQYYFQDDVYYYVVALGSMFGTEIGSAYEVTLDNGTKFNVIMGDCKSGVYYGHSCTNFDKEYCINMIEFFVDFDYVPEKVANLGTYSGLDYFNGNIISIEYIGQIWKSAK